MNETTAILLVGGAVLAVVLYTRKDSTGGNTGVNGSSGSNSTANSGSGKNGIADSVESVVNGAVNIWNALTGKGG